MEKKYVFLDIDGTLVDTDEVIHQSSVDAIHKARANGHKLFLCTGREKNIVTPKLMDIGFSDGVFSAGAVVFCDSKIVYHNPLPADKYDRIINSLVKHNAMIVLESMNSEILLMPTYHKQQEHFRLWLEKLGSVFADEISRALNDIDKIVYVDSDVPADIISREIGDDCTLVTMSYSNDCGGGEINNAGISKATGIKRVLSYYGGDIKNTVGIGDGGNDIEMLKYCSLGIAMGNADQRAKKAADMVSADIKDDGLYKAFEMAGLI